MSKFRFVNIIDTLFFSVVTFFIIFAWIQFFLKNLFLALFLSAFVSFGLLFIVRWFKNRKHLTLQQRANNSASFKRFKLAIQIASHTQLVNIIKKILPANCTIKSHFGDVVYEKNNVSHIITFLFDNELTESKLLDIIKTKRFKHIIIICSNINTNSQNVAKVFKNKRIDLLSLEQLFDLCNENGITIDTSYINIEKSKITLKEIFKNSLSRNKSKGYFISGLVLLFTSIIIPFKIYYVVFSTILFILSAVCRFKPIALVNKSIFD